MDNFSLNEILNIKISTLIAGLLGAFVASLRKSEGTLQARLGGYAMACVTILYAVPFIIFLCDHYGYPLHSTAENLISFIFGTVSKGLTEQFIDDPVGTLKRWAANIKLFRRLFSLPDSNPEKKEQENEN
jgi:hypothetical protein